MSPAPKKRWEKSALINSHKYFGNLSASALDKNQRCIRGILRSTGLNKRLKAKDWAAFARGYNGPEYAKNKYDARLKQAYKAYPIEKVDT